MQLVRLSLVFILINFIFLTKAYSVGTHAKTANTVFVQEQFGASDVESFLMLTPKEVAEYSGQKTTFKERLVLKLVQRKLKKQLKNNDSVDVKATYEAYNTNTKPIGFLLGFLLGLLGVLISYAISKEAGNASWGGFAALLLLLLVLLSAVA